MRNGRLRNWLLLPAFGLIALTACAENPQHGTKGTQGQVTASLGGATSSESTSGEQPESGRKPVGGGGSGYWEVDPTGRFINYYGTNGVDAIDCADGMAFSIAQGSSNKVTLTGNCIRVSALGQNNTIIADSVTERVRVQGSGNSVVFHAGDPAIENTGQNEVRKE